MSSDFIRPPPAPVFYPTLEDFTDPISYVHRISPIAFNYGICKIHPPDDWKPPFSIDEQNFTFVPRVQELSDVCAYNRVRYHFITSLINFWEAQEVTLFVPQIKGRSIDIYRLWKQVKCAGGYETVCEKKLWCKVCEQINLPAIPSFASALCSHYKKYLLPYDAFIASESVINEQNLKRSHANQSLRKKPSVDKMVCSVCNLGNNDEYLLLCDGCETYGACHTYCLDPPLSDVPKGNWYCRSCVIRRYKQLNQFEVFGFKSSNVKYTLHTFGIRADDFKVKHFGKPTHMVSTEEAETEFWRLVDSEDTEVTVEYGADLSAHEHKSGFPTSRPGRVSQKLKHYINSPWNLNNTPLLDGSALRFLPRDISGMIIPWCYVGMAFSCFCWHTEDHWSYSINYLHIKFPLARCSLLLGDSVYHLTLQEPEDFTRRGEPKTWYGVPTDYADAFEMAMRSEVPELFVNSPDLLHHMTTMVSPSRLQAHGVPVYRLDQMVGEFVVTFPRAFHAGFNQGFNFAEAVNFCPPDWLDYGRNCIEHYALLHRTPVFSHAELLCRMAKSVEPLSVEFLAVVSRQLEDLLTTERSLRRHLARIGVRLTERMVFENSDDEKRECDLCRTTLYLSSLGCKCSESMVCLAHHQIRTCCSRDNQVMRYRYDLDELTEFKDKLQLRLVEYKEWKYQIENDVFAVMHNKSSSNNNPTKLQSSTITLDYDNHSTESSNNLIELNDHLKSVDNDNNAGNSNDISNETVKASDDTITEPKLEDNNADEVNELIHVNLKSSTSSQVKQEERQKLTLVDLNKLLKIGQTRQYPNPVVERLSHIVHTIGECSSVVGKLITSYKKACEEMKSTQSVAVKSPKSEMTDSGHEEDENNEGHNSGDVELTHSGNQPVKEVLQSSASIKSSSESDNETSIEDSRNSTNTSLTKVSQMMSEGGIGVEVEEEENTEEADQEEKAKTMCDEKILNTSLEVVHNNYKFRSRYNNYPCSNWKGNKFSASKAPLISKLTLNEFASLIKLATNLPVVLPELNELLEFVDHITSWRSELRNLLMQLNKKLNTINDGDDVRSDTDVNINGITTATTNSITINDKDNGSIFDQTNVEVHIRSILPSVLKVEEYINFASVIDIELPELNQLKRVHDCLTWFEDVDEILTFKYTAICTENNKTNNKKKDVVDQNVINECEMDMTCKPTLNDLCELQLKGNQIAASITYAMNKHEDGYAYDFSSHSVLDAALTVQSRRLLETVSKVTLVEERLKGIINAEPCSLSLVTVKEQLAMAMQLPIHLTATSDVQEICEKAEKYEKQFNILAKLLFENNNLSIKQELDEQQQPAHTPRDENKSKENIHIKDDESSSEEKLDEVGLGSVDCTPSKWQSYFNTLEENIQNCVIKFPQIDSIRTLLSDLSIFYGKLTKLFLRPESTQSLLEILLPRSASALEWLIRLDGGPEIPDSYRSDFKLEVNNCPPTTYKRHTRSPHFQASTYKSLCKDSAQEFAKISSMKDWNQMYTSVYNRFVEAEVSLMHYLRSTNMRKSRAKNQEKIVYCICRQPGLTSFMLQCELCRDWVHGRCVTLPALKDSETERMRYICPRCECSLRPDLKQVLELLSDLSSLARNRNESNQNKAMHSNNKNNNSRDIYFHQFPEFVAVQLLCDRALCFIKYIQNEIASNAELKQALTDYEHFSNMTMPSFDLIEQNISEELIQPSDHKDVSYAPMDCKKQPVRTTSPSLSSRSMGPIRSASDFRTLKSHSVHGHGDIDGDKKNPLGSYLPTAKPRSGITMPSKSPWELINSATLSKEMQVSRNPRELIVADNIRSSSSRQPDLESQFSDYKQSRKHQSLTSNNNLRMHSGEQKETEAAEALAGLSASLNTQSSVVAGYKPAHNQRSYGNFKSDATTYGQMGNPDSFTARRFNKHETVRHDSGFNSRPTDRSDPSYFHKRNCGQVMSSDHPRDPSRCDRPLHSKVLTNEGESHQTASCLQSTRRFFFPLSVEARRILENLIMEACLLEVHLPQTRWLWQLHLASDRETASCGALHPSIAKIEEDRLKRRILRHLQQSNQSKCSDRPRAGRRKRGSSGAEDNSANVDSKVELSDDSNISSSEISELQKRQRYSSEYSEGEEKQSNSSVSDPVHYVTSLPNRKPYRLRGRASDLAIARRYKLGRPKRLLPVRGRRSVQRPAHAMGYRSMRPGVQKHMYNVKIQGELQYKDRTVAPNKSSKLQLINRTRNLSGQSCIPSRRTGRVYRGERLVRRLYPCSNNEFSDSSTSDEHVDVVAELPLLSEQHLSRSESPRYHKMMSNYSNYARSEIKRRLAFRSDRLNQPSPIMDTYESEQYEDSSTEDQLSNYEDEECPAKPCLNPRTGTVKWVQCEACCQWYHQICVGIHHEFQLPKVYLCRRCHRRSTTTMTPRRKQLSSSRTLGRLPRRHFLSKSSSKLHLRKSVTVSPIKLTSHVSQRLVGWNTRPSLSPCLPKLQPYDDQNASSEVDKDDDAHEGNNDNNIIDQRDAGKSALSQDIPVLKNQLLDSWTDISQSSEESSVKHPANSPIDSSQLDEPPVIDAYEHVSNNSTNTETAETSKGPTEVLLEALDVMSGGIQSNDTV